MKAVVPPVLRPGDRVVVVAPARKITRAELVPAVRLLHEWGLDVRLGDTIEAEDAQFAGSDALRRADLQRALDDPAVRAILCARGGYGTARILDDLDLSGFRRVPKWVAGFSDPTALLAHLWRHTHTVSLHATMPVLMGRPDHHTADGSLRALLFGESLTYAAPPQPRWGRRRRPSNRRSRTRSAWAWPDPRRRAVLRDARGRCGERPAFRSPSS